MFWGLWDCQVDTIIDVKLGDADADSYKYELMAALLAWWETIKKDKESKHCHYQQTHFSRFFLSVERMLGREALAVLLRLSWIMSDKMEEPLLQVQGWVNGRIAIAVAVSYSQMFRGARLPSPLREREPDWEQESQIGLAG